MLTNTDVLDVCAVMLQRCGMTAEQLAAHMARPELPTAEPTEAAAPVAIGGEDGDGLTPRMRQALKLIDNPKGALVIEIQQAMGITDTSASWYMTQLVGKGKAVRVQMVGVRAVRWFATQAQAHAWREDQLGVQQRPTPAASFTGPAPRSTPVPPPAPAKPPRAPDRNTVSVPTISATRLTGDAIVPPGVRITVAPTPAPRYSPEPGAALTGGFSTSRPGINPLTGKAWA